MNPDFYGQTGNVKDDHKKKLDIELSIADSVDCGERSVISAESIGVVGESEGPQEIDLQSEVLTTQCVVKKPNTAFALPNGLSWLAPPQVV